MKSKNQDLFNIQTKKDEYTICLAGNPNTGKSSIFNILTGLKQHTGNWPGKTVSNARGSFSIDNKLFNLIDVPGTYSLFGLTDDETVARDYICFGKNDIIIVVTDATCLARTLNLVFQVLEYNQKVIMVVNLMDEARKKGIKINKLKLMYHLGIPVILTSAKTKEGIDELKSTIIEVIEDKFPYQTIEIKYPSLEERIGECEKKLSTKLNTKRTLALRIIDSDEGFKASINKYGTSEQQDDFNALWINNDKKEIRETIISENYRISEKIVATSLTKTMDTTKTDRKIDQVLTSRFWGIPIMIALLAFVLYLTISFANYPSKLIYHYLFKVENYLLLLFDKLGFIPFIRDLLVLGIYRTIAWVVSVMLPPMAIFFPLFTLLEDLGYLPRVAYNLDYQFKKACAHGKQCLTMCMGFGCNAAGVTGTRIIDSPREKLIAILTNTFVPCNGRFPTIITISTAFLAISTNYNLNSIIPTIVVTILICLGVFVTLFVSKILSKTILKGEASSFTLELPPYRKPNILRVIYTSIIDRTIFLLIRAIKVAAPFGGLIWLLANVNINDQSLLLFLSNFFNPIGKLIGLDGTIMLAFILALPANEILLPIIIMTYSSTGMLTDFDSILSLRTLFLDNGWTLLTAINILLFSLLHWPCSTTLLTIKKETGSYKYTFLSFIIPTIIGFAVCMLTTLLWNLFI